MIMKRVFNWLEPKFSRHSAIAEAEELHIPVGVSVTPKENIKENHTVDAAYNCARKNMNAKQLRSLASSFGEQYGDR